MKPWRALRDSEFNDAEHRISFTVQIKPTAQPRHTTGRNKKTGRPIHYEAAKKHRIHLFKSMVAHEARKAMRGRPPFDLPFWVHIVNYFQPPKSLSDKRLGEMAGLCATESDFDNLGKAVTDACNKVIWTDDRRIVSGTSDKFYCGRDEQPYVTVDIRLLGKELADDEK